MPDDPSFHVVIDEAPTVVITIAGELDMDSAPQLMDAAADVLASRPPAIALEASGITFVDSSGLQAILKLSQASTREGVTCAVRNPSATLVRLLALTGISGVLTVESDEQVGPTT